MSSPHAFHISSDEESDEGDVEESPFLGNRNVKPLRSSTVHCIGFDEDEDFEVISATLRGKYTVQRVVSDVQRVSIAVSVSPTCIVDMTSESGKNAAKILSDMDTKFIPAVEGTNETFTPSQVHANKLGYMTDSCVFKGSADACHDLVRVISLRPTHHFRVIIGKGFIKPDLLKSYGPTALRAETCEDAIKVLRKRSKTPKVEIVILHGTPESVARCAKQAHKHAIFAQCPIVAAVDNENEAAAAEICEHRIDDILWSGHALPSIVDRRIRKFVASFRLARIASMNSTTLQEEKSESSESKKETMQQSSKRMQRKIDEMVEYQEYLIWTLLRKYRFNMIPPSDDASSPSTSPSPSPTTTKQLSRKSSFSSSDSLSSLRVDTGSRGGGSAIRFSDLVLGAVLGTGGFGCVRVATNKRNGYKYAIKQLNKDALDSIEDIDRVNTEIQLLSTLNHPHILRLARVFHTPKSVFICTEYLGDDLRQFASDNAKNPCESKVKEIFAQIVSAVHFMHTRSVCHRDLKLDNILWVPNVKEEYSPGGPRGGALKDADPCVKLVDFGFATKVKPGKKQRLCCGTKGYLAPEIIGSYSYDGLLADVWSCGIVLAAMMFGNSIVKKLSSDEPEEYTERLASFFRDESTLFESYSEEAVDILAGFLVIDPAQRPSITRILQDSRWLDNCKSINKRHSRIRRSKSNPSSPSKLLSRRNSASRIYSFDSAEDSKDVSRGALPPIDTKSPRSGSPLNFG